MYIKSLSNMLVVFIKYNLKENHPHTGNEAIKHLFVVTILVMLCSLFFIHSFHDIDSSIFN